MGLPVTLPTRLEILATGQLLEVRHVKAWDWTASLGFHNDWAPNLRSRLERHVEVMALGTYEVIREMAASLGGLSLEPCRAPGREGTCRERHVVPLCLSCEARELLERWEIKLEL